MEIRADDLTSEEVIELLREHLRWMRAVSPPESVHALDLDGLRHPSITFWTIWNNIALAGCGALKELNAQHAEIKSMRTANGFQRQGVASKMLQHILSVAADRGYRQISLETGSQPYFEPARRLYEKFGFESCGPFEGYWDDPNSYFMTKAI